MKYVGLAFAIGALFVFVRAYTASLKKRGRCYTEISRLLSHIAEGLKTQRATLFSLCSDFDCEELRECGFFDLAIKNGDAKEGVERLLMDCTDKKKLVQFLCNFGSGYLDTELKRSSQAAEYFAKRSDEESGECADKIRVSLLLFCSFAVALALICV